MIEIKQDLIRKSKYSRPKIKMKKVEGLVFHWVANPKTTAKQTRDYFNLKNKKVFSSAHYCVDDNEIIQCIPDNEMAYHVGARNYPNQRVLKRINSTYPNNTLLGIEMCHFDWSGKFSRKTLNNTIELARFLIKKHKIKENCLFRHFDVTGKNCPKYFVENPTKWVKFYREILEK